MPLYDFICQDCEQYTILLLSHDAEAICPHCGSKKMSKQFAPFAIHNGQTGHLQPTTTQSESSQAQGQRHVHTAACSSQCGASTKADALIKKYLR